MSLMNEWLEREFFTTNPRVVAKRIFRATEAGVSVNIEGDTVTISCIVEGSSAVVGPYTLTWPFMPNEFWDLVTYANDEAVAIWEEENEDEEH